MRETRITERRYGNIFTRIGVVESSHAALIPTLLLASASLLWLVSLPQIDPSAMTDMGLVSVLPVTFFAAMVVLTISFLIALHHRDTPELILFLHILLLILILHATPQIVYGTLRYSWAWKHLGIVDYIQRHGSVNPTIFNLNAYHNWPGFFALAAFFNQVAGVQSSVTYAGWGPFFFNLLDLGALIFILKSLSTDRRIVFLSAWFFYLFNWIGQDYFSPQAFAYFLYLIAFAILLKYFRMSNISSKLDIQKYLPNRFISKIYNTVIDRSIQDYSINNAANANQRVMLMAILVLIFIVIASSHQLTPMMLISGLVLLVLFQVTNQRYIPILMAIITTAWVIFMAVGFLDGNLGWIVKSIGSLLDNVNSNLINLNVASPGQQIIAKIDRLLSVIVWIFGFFGIYRRLRAGHWDLPAILLAISPIPILVTNAYGGEMLFRVYMFSLPFITFFMAGLFYPSIKSGTSFITPALVIGVTFLIIPGFLYSYYGKERMYYFAPDEVAAAQYVYDNAPQGSLIVDNTWDWPRQAIHYEWYSYFSLVKLPKDKMDQVMQDPAKTLYDLMGVSAPQAVAAYGSESGGQHTAFSGAAGQNGLDVYPTAYLVITRSQMADAEMTGVLPAEWFSRIEDGLSHSSSFKIVYQSANAMVFQLVHP